MKLLAQTIEHINTNVPSLGERCGGAVRFDQIRDYKGDIELPFASVILTSAEADPNQSQMVEQRVKREFAVCIVVANQDRSGKEALENLEDLRVEILGVILGWIPTGARDKCTLIAEAVLDVNANRISYQMDFETSEIVCERPPEELNPVLEQICVNYGDQTHVVPSE